MSLPDSKRELLEKFVGGYCENCHKHSEKDDVGKLTAHRIKRGNVGGLYILRNILMVCTPCHKLIHSGEFK